MEILRKYFCRAFNILSHLSFFAFGFSINVAPLWVGILFIAFGIGLDVGAFLLSQPLKTKDIKYKNLVAENVPLEPILPQQKAEYAELMKALAKQMKEMQADK